MMRGIMIVVAICVWLILGMLLAIHDLLETIISLL